MYFGQLILGACPQTPWVRFADFGMIDPLVKRPKLTPKPNIHNFIFL
jgi:hypothetical protein